MKGESFWLWYRLEEPVYISFFSESNHTLCEYLPGHIVHVVYWLFNFSFLESSYRTSWDAYVTLKTRMQMCTKGFPNKKKANRCWGWSELRRTQKDSMCIHVLIFHNGKSRHLRVTEKETKLLFIKYKYLLSLYVTEAELKAVHQWRGCGPGVLFLNGQWQYQ